MTALRKKLIYHFYAFKGWQDNPIVILHMRLLDYYSDYFDEANFIIAVDDLTDTHLISDIEKAILKLGYLNVKFNVVQNDPKLKQNKTFYEKFILGISKYNGVLYFGHLNCLCPYNDGRGNYTTLSKLICFSYYNLFNEKMYKELCRDYMYSIGIPILTSSIDESKWECTGGFIGVNAMAVKRIIEVSNITLDADPITCCNNETYLGDRISFDVCYTNTLYLRGEWDAVDGFDDQVNIRYEKSSDDLSEFNSFHEKFS